jgi:hypothetical protein
VNEDFWNYGDHYNKHRAKIKFFAEANGWTFNGHANVIISIYGSGGNDLHFVVDLSATDPTKFMQETVKAIYKKGLENGTENTKHLLREFLGLGSVEDRLDVLENKTERLD